MRYGLQIILLSTLSLLITACASNKAVPNTPFAPTNRVVEKTVAIPPPSLQQAYHLQKAANPALEKAYQHYLKTGVAETIETDQFIQFPFSTGTQPIIPASVLELTVISLEVGEQVTSVSSGDPTRWSYSLVYSGANHTRQAHVMIKPAKSNRSTDFFITTDRRAYLLKLVSTEDGKYARNVRFWYPDDLQNNLVNYNAQQQANIHDNPVVASVPNIDIEHLNFNYHLTATRPTPDWTPRRVFDDGLHTYIQFPREIAANDLPALFVMNGDTQEMVNYRVKEPYFVVDKVFKIGVLITGVGRSQHRVTIINDQGAK